MCDSKLNPDGSGRAGAGEVCKRQAGSNYPGICQGNGILTYDSAERSKAVVKLISVALRPVWVINSITPTPCCSTSEMVWFFNPRLHKKREG